jgi:hypothetical protein
VIVYAREYESDNVSLVAFNDYHQWAAKNVPDKTSAWRTRNPEGTRFFVIVLDESEGHLSLGFEWVSGEPHSLSEGQAYSFFQRRINRSVLAYEAGRRGSFTEKIHYGDAVAPRITPDGVWELPTGGQG